MLTDDLRTERSRALELFLTLTDVEEVDCELVARTNAIDGLLHFLVKVNGPGTDLGAVQAHAPLDQFRTVIAMHGIELHVVPEGEKKEEG